METTTLETMPDFSEAMQTIFENKEIVSLTPIYSRLENPVNLLNALKMVGTIRDEVPVYMDRSNIIIKTLDLAEVSLVEVAFRPESLSMKAGPVGFTIRIDDLIRMFPKLKPKEDRYVYVDLTVETNCLEVDMKDKGVSFKIPIYELALNPKPFPDPKFSIDAKVRPLNIKDIVNALEQLKEVSDCVVMSVEDKLKLSSKGEILEKTIEIPCLEIYGSAKTSYDIRRLLHFLKAFSKLGGDVLIEFGTDLPIKFSAEYSYSDAPLNYVIFYNAPRLEKTD